MAILTTFLDRLLSQEVARSNAAGAAVRLRQSRRRLDDVNAFLDARHHDSAQQPVAARVTDTASANATRSRPEPP